MKKFIAIILSLCLSTSLFVPIQIFAQSDQGLEQAIRTVKERIEIPEEFTEFNYNISMDGDKKTWYLSWNSKQNRDGSINVRIDDTGKISSYNKYIPYTDMDGKLPKVNKEDAKAIAENFIKKVNPETFDEIRYIENHQMSLMDRSYYFEYIRVANNIPFYENNITVNVNRQTGEVESYYCNWIDQLSFPAADQIISLEEAEKAFKENLGLKLVYKYTYDNENREINTYPAYVPKYKTSEYLDAFTGEKVDLGHGYYYGIGGRGEMDAAKSVVRGVAPAAANVTLSPEEIKAIENVSNLLSQEEAENKARSLKILELTKDFKLNNASLFRDWYSKDNFVWELYFVNENKEEDAEQRLSYRSVSVSLDAKSGEATNFYIGEPYSEVDIKKPKFDKEAAKAAVEKFVKEFKAEKFKQVEYDELPDMVYPVEEQPRYFNFNYVRKVNDITFPDNGFTVRFNAVTGKIVSFNMTWFDTNFTAIDKAISIDKVSEKLFNEIGLELQYKANYNRSAEATKIIPPQPVREIPEVKLVYALKSGKPVCFDAFTGIILDYNGKPYKGNEPVEYTDISNHFAEKYIYALAQYGIALEGPEFKPDEQILQKEFLQLLAKTINYYSPIIPLRDEKEVNELYDQLIREGIVKENEKAPNAVLTREDSIKFIIRALKYDKVADIQGIFNCNFSDKDMISPELLGYVVIAQGLGIVNGNGEYFYPQNALTRAEAVVMIYNYLQI